jgi:hypothetical protein
MRVSVSAMPDHRRVYGRRGTLSSDHSQRPSRGPPPPARARGGERSARDGSVGHGEQRQRRRRRSGCSRALPASTRALAPARPAQCLAQGRRMLAGTGLSGLPLESDVRGGVADEEHGRDQQGNRQRGAIPASSASPRCGDPYAPCDQELLKLVCPLRVRSSARCRCRRNSGPSRTRRRRRAA